MLFAVHSSQLKSGGGGNGCRETSKENTYVCLHNMPRWKGMTSPFHLLYTIRNVNNRTCTFSIIRTTSHTGDIVLWLIDKRV